MWYVKELQYPPRLTAASLSVRIGKRQRKSALLRYKQSALLHGVAVLANGEFGRVPRAIWLAIIACSLGATIAFYVLISQQFSNQVLETIIAVNNYPYYLLNFPTVGICMAYKINASRIDEATHFFLPNGTEQAKTKLREVARFIEYLQFESLEFLKGIDLLPDLAELDSVDLTQLANFLAVRCEHIFVECVWSGRQINCCEFFVRESTRLGVCHVFNSLISDQSRRLKVDDYYPLKESRYGRNSGLTVKLRVDSSVRHPDAKHIDGDLQLMVKKAQQMQDPRTYLLPAGVGFSFAFSTELSFTETSALSLTPEERGCVFTDEAHRLQYKGAVKGLEYRQSNCYTQCHRNYLLKYCNCTMPLFFPYLERESTERRCRAEDLKCLFNHRSIFSYTRRIDEEQYVIDVREGMTCPCLNSCKSVEYFITLDSHAIDNGTTSNPNIKHSELNFFYQPRNAIMYVTKFRYSWVDLLVSYSGILGLFLGGSVTSAIQLLYYFVIACVDIITEVWRKKIVKVAPKKMKF